jgi:uncharacterized protein (UPF0335 family)
MGYLSLSIYKCTQLNFSSKWRVALEQLSTNSERVERLEKAIAQVQQQLLD